MKIAMILSVACLIIACAKQQSTEKRTDKTVSLPNGQPFTFWDDQTNYRQIYYVDQTNPNADDNNPGTETKPFLSIGKAADIAEFGSKIIVKKGIYRECVKLANSGIDEKNMIYYEAFPGDDVIISGSEIVKEKWSTSLTPSLPHQIFSHKLWMVSIPHSYFGKKNPFRGQNADAYEMEVMNWAKDWTNKVPYTLSKGLIFQDGKRLTQLCAYEDIVKLPGSYWVDTTSTETHACTIHIRPFNDLDPNTQNMEITTRETIFNPLKKGIDFIRVKGFIFEQVGNGFQRSGKGAFSTYGGKNWIIENNIFRGINSVAIEIGAVTDEHLREKSRFGAAESGRHLVRNNTIYDCGTGGIQGLINIENLIENNHLFNIGWQEAEFYYETAAIKILNAKNCLVRGNHIHDIEAASGIWVDYGNVNTRVCQNLIYNVSCNFGGIFIECSVRPNLVDNNFLWNCAKNGIYQHDCDSLIIVNNTVVHSSENGIKMSITPGRGKPGARGETTTARNNEILYNILIDNASPFSYIDSINHSDYNFISKSDTAKFNLKRWQKKGLDANSQLVNIRAAFDLVNLSFTSKLEKSLPLVARFPLIHEDMLGISINSEEITPGAIQNFGQKRYSFSDRFFHSSWRNTKSIN